MFWVEFLIVLVLIFWGVKEGGLFMTLAGGIGIFLFTFVFRAPMSDPPITVFRIIFLVVLAGGAMQACGGVDYLVTIADKLIRKYPKAVTIVAPLVSYIFAFCCGTGHIVYSLLPVTNEVALENGVRPERPIAASVVASQNALCASPLAAATAAMIGFIEPNGISMVSLLLVVIPATLLGTLAASLVMVKKGKELYDDPEVQARIASGQLVIKKHEDKDNASTAVPTFSTGAKASVAVFLIGMLAIVLLGAIPSLRPTLGDGTVLGMTDLIQIVMLIVAAIIFLVMKHGTGNGDPGTIMDTQIFKAGMFACAMAMGLCWMVNILIGANSSYLTDVVSQFTNQYPWVYIIACYLVANITTSQASTTAIVVPLGLALGISTPVLVAGWVLIGSHYLIPDASEALAAIPFDTAGTTKIGKYVFNTSYLLPSLAMAVVDAAAAYLIGMLVF